MTRPSFAIYNASAGSGKTYTLVKEYLKIILTANANDAYRHILAITFTNKAVHEMKSRIVNSLLDFTKDEPNAESIHLMEDICREEKTLSVNKIKAKSQQIVKHIIHNYAAFDISTIDKFTHKVIRTFANDLGLSVSFEVSLESQNLLKEAVDTMISKAGEDVALTKLLVDFSLEKTDDDKSWDISRDIFETGKMILNEETKKEIAHFKDTSIEGFMEMKSKLIKINQELENKTITLATKALTVLEDKQVDLKSFSGGYFPKHLQSIVTKKFSNSTKKYREFEDFKINKTAKDTFLIESLIPELLLLTNEIYDTFDKLRFYKAILKNITPLSLLNNLDSTFGNIQKEQNLLSIAEFNTLIHNEIQNQPAPFIYERLGERYQHFFIDEFQDTSQMQWENLIPLINNATSSEINGQKGTLMIVGDPKQSIYRWRGGKAEQFIELYQGKNPFNNPERKVTYLETNYRSYSEIIDFNNTFFKQIARYFEHLDYADLYENQSWQKTNDKKGGFVSLSFLDLKAEIDIENDIYKNDLYAQKTLEIIAESISKGFTYNDIVVLTRKRNEGIAVANHLIAHNIAVISSENLLIANAAEVQMIIHTLRYIHNAFDLESKAKMLYFLAIHKKHDFETADFIAKGMAFENDMELENWFQTFDVYFSFSAIKKKSLYEMVETIIAKLLPDTKAEKTNIEARHGAYVHYFLDLVLEKDTRNQSGLADFLDYWDKNKHKLSVPSPEGANAVRIMTIHKSKGLEFPVVIMPFADENYIKKPLEKMWLETHDDNVALEKVLIDKVKDVTSYNEDSKLIYNQKEQEALLDNINVLYVALTRAKEQLHIVSNKIKPNKDGDYPNTMARFFVDYLIDKGVFNDSQEVYTFGNPEKVSEKSNFQATANTIENVSDIFDPKNIKIATKEALMWGTHQQEAIAFGNILHEILATINTKDDIDFALNNAIEQGLIHENQRGITLQKLEAVVHHELLQDYFSIENQVFNEQTIISNAITLKPDKMVLDKDNNMYLLDYKTGMVLQKHQVQIENYEAIITTMGYKVTKKALVYIGERINVSVF